MTRAHAVARAPVVLTAIIGFCITLLGVETALAQSPETADNAAQPGEAQGTTPEPRQGEAGSPTPKGALPAGATETQQASEKDPEANKNAAQASEPPLTASEIKARDLFMEGRQLMTAKNYAAACKKFSESLKFTDGIGTKFNLADCQEQLGQVARAHALFLEVAEVAKQTAQGRRHEVALARARALEPKLGSLSIELADPNNEPEIFLGQERVLESALGTKIFVDPGKYELRARAPGKKTWKKLVSVAASKSLKLRVPRLEAIETAPPEPEPVPEESETPAPEETRRLRWLPPVVLGVGAAGLFAGLAGTQQYRTSHQDAKDVCPSSYGCTEEEINRHDELVEDARQGRILAAVGYGVAAACLAGGLVYYLTDSSSTESETAAQLMLAPTLGTGMAGGMVHARF